VGLGIEEAPLHRRGPGARSPVQEHDREAVGPALLLPVHHVAAAQGQRAGLERIDLGEEP
jgi:hypothetical protein